LNFDVPVASSAVLVLDENVRIY